MFNNRQRQQQEIREDGKRFGNEERKRLQSRVDEIINIRTNQINNGFTPCYCEHKKPQYSHYCRQCTHDKCTSRNHMDVTQI